MNTSSDLKPEVWEHTLSDIKRYEGFREHAYLDTVGVWTIGYGETSGVRRGDTITREDAEIRLDDRLAAAVVDIRRLLGQTFTQLDGPRQSVMINMSYNLGYTRLSKFYEAIKAIKAKDYINTARQMRSSKWCGQVKSRCDELTKSMATGQFIASFIN